jgi:ATP-dependent RNA helicase RhlE
LKISTTDYSQTLDFTADTSDDIKALMKEIEDYQSIKKKNKKK